MKNANNYAFIDSQNLNLGIQKMGWKLDWRKFRQFLADEYGVSKAFMFIGYMQENEFLYEQMHDIGYLIVLKPTVESHVEEKTSTADDKEAEPEKKTVKGNIDADLVLYALKEMKNYDQAIIGADILSFDIYPVGSDTPRVKDKLEYVAIGVTNLVRRASPGQQVWAVLETTALDPTRPVKPSEVRSVLAAA